MVYGTRARTAVTGITTATATGHRHDDIKSASSTCGGVRKARAIRTHVCVFAVGAHPRGQSTLRCVFPSILQRCSAQNNSAPHSQVVVVLLLLFAANTVKLPLLLMIMSLLLLLVVMMFVADGIVHPRDLPYSIRHKTPPGADCQSSTTPRRR